MLFLIVSTQTDVAALTHQRSIIQPDNGLGKPKAIVIAASKVTSLDQQQVCSRNSISSDVVDYI